MLMVPTKRIMVAARFLEHSKRTMGRSRRVVACAIIFLVFLSGESAARREKRESEDDENHPDKVRNNPNHPGYYEANWNHSEHFMAGVKESVMKKLMPMVIRSSSSVELSGKCMQSLFKMLMAIRKNQLWAHKIIDATGKPGSGFFAGNLGHVGDYDECLDTEIPDLKDRDGKYQKGMYCLVTFVPLLPPKPQLYTLFHKVPELRNVSAKNTSFAETAKNAHFMYHLQMRLGICMPNSCTADDVLNIAKQIPEMAHIRGDMNVYTCETKEPLKLETHQIVILAIVGVVATLLIVGTALDVVAILRQGNDPEPLSVTKKTWHRLLVCFSVYTNYLKLVNCHVKEENKHLLSLNGMRFITVTWVLAGHTYLYADYNHMKQSMRVSTLPPGFFFQVIANAMLTVDTYILMSGMLVTYNILKQQEKKKGINIFMYIFHRYWRLTPLHAITIGMLLVIPIISNGPVWKITLDPWVNKCKMNWWTNLLYVNNYVNAYEYCMEHAWYLGVDMQLHILSLFCMLPLIRWPKLGATVGVVFAVGFSIVAAIVNLINDLPPSPLGLYPDPDDRVYVEVPNYFKPYGHVGPYYVGVLLGWIVAKKPKIVIPRALRLGGWLFFTTMQLTVLYGAYPWNNGSVPGPIVSALYAGCSKTVWAFGIFWVLFVCCTGNGGVINDILSWKAWIPMARLSYAFYLVHPLVIWTHEAFARTRTLTHHYNWVYNMMGHYMTSMVLALIVSLSFEAPFLAMEKILFGRGSDDDDERSKRNGYHSTPPTKKIGELPSYDAEMRSRTFTTSSKEQLTNGHNGHGHNHHNGHNGHNGQNSHNGHNGHNGLFRNGGDGLYKSSTENGKYKGIDNGAFCRL